MADLSRTQQVTVTDITAAPSRTGYSLANYAANQTGTNVKTTPGLLHAVVINTKGTVASATTLWDGQGGTGTKICTIDSLNLSGTFTYDATCATGITITTTGTAAPDVTVLYI